MIHKFRWFGISSLFLILIIGLSSYYIKSKSVQTSSFQLSANDNLNADFPDQAGLQNYLTTLDPNLQTVPSEKLYEAYTTVKELSYSKTYQSTSNLEWENVASNMGGRTRTLMWDPNDTAGTKLWAGSVTGGLWYNNNIYNDTCSWVFVEDFWANLSVSCLAFDPNDPMIFYAGTGEYQTARHIYRESSGLGFGIWKSTDGGESWEIIPSTENFKYISDIKVREEDEGSVIYAGVVSGYYMGVNHNSEPTEGLYRSVNGGYSWEQVLPDVIGENETFGPADLEITVEGRIFVGTMKNMNGDGGATILYSDEGIAGSWTIFDDYEQIISWNYEYPVPGRVTLACAPSNHYRVYAIVGAGWYNSNDFNYSKGKYILWTINGGESWTECNIPNNTPEWANIAWHSMAAAVNPFVQGELYVGGKDVWKTSSSGYSWSCVSDWSLMYSGGGDDYVHCDQHVIQYSENSADELWIANDGGLFFSGNAQEDIPVFQEKNKNYNTLQFYTCDLHPNPDSNYFVGGLQDNGTLLYSGDALDIHDMIDVGDGAYCFFDENEPEILITSSYFNNYSLFINRNKIGDMGMDGSGVFINPADYDSENNILYANAVKFNNINANQILRISGIPENPTEQLISLPIYLNTWFSHVKVSPYSPAGTSTLFLGSQNGRLFKVENAHSTPQVFEINTEVFPEANIACIALGGDEQNLFVVFSNYGVPSVWFSNNGGEDWTNIDGNLPDMPVRWALFHPNNNNMVMLATELGIWTTQDINAGFVIWEPDFNFPRVRVDMLQVRPEDKTVLAATHGRGLIYTTWEDNPFVSIEKKNHPNVLIYPNPATDYIQISVGNNEKLSIEIYSQEGRLVFNGTLNENDRINLKDWKSGIYFAKINLFNSQVISKFIVQ